ncbi:hypothetical protein [Burkholderia pseudomultivorans]|uniref:hypothetical protein n=1 Tax=Burkholderia pseudomultivorans TaxID=1207504 RepID=UPI000841CF8E|nr:hypothetical protein [Burkholderia pseudomultivorans]AOI92779.1 hypothetical protein WS57_29455 [Burkholderia pseudomultivorans]
MRNEHKVDANKRYLLAHLTAKLFRLASINNEGFEPTQLPDFQLIPKIVLTSFKSGDQSDTGTYNKITMFCGVFAKGMDYTTLPFVVSFNYRAGVPRAALGQFAIGCRVATRERILAFLSVIDYLELLGDLPGGSLEDHARRLTKSGKLTERVAIVDEYQEFCTRAARDLPYDDLIAA